MADFGFIQLSAWLLSGLLVKITGGIPVKGARKNGLSVDQKSERLLQKGMGFPRLELFRRREKAKDWKRTGKRRPTLGPENKCSRQDQLHNLQDPVKNKTVHSLVENNYESQDGSSKIS